MTHASSCNPCLSSRGHVIEVGANDVSVSFVMPCLNEARTLGNCIRKAHAFIQQSGLSAEIVVADNGSVDGSQDIAQRLGARVIAVPQRGYGAALQAGIAAARGRYVVMGDADDSYDFSKIGVFLDDLRRGSQLVMGNRFDGGIEPGAMPWHHRYVGNPVLSGVGRLFFSSPVRDFHCGLRAFEREAILRLGLTTPGMEFASEMVVKATLAGLRITEVPTTLSRDGRDRPPHLRSFRDGWRHLKFLLLYCPRWLFFVPGLLMLSGGWIGLALLGLGPVRVANAVMDIHTMLFAGFAALMGLQLVSLSVVAHMIALQQRVVVSIPQHVRWIAELSLDHSLLFSLGVGLFGVLLAAATTWDWIGAGFPLLDPRQVMRTVIPACVLMASGLLLGFCSFLVHQLARGMPQLSIR